MQPPIDRGTVLLTGASSGIGQELARLMAPRARALVLVARRAGRLEELRDRLQERYPQLGLHLYPCDLGDPVAVGLLLDRVAADVDAIDVLVNNAGLGYRLRFDQAGWSRLHQMVQVNVVALARLTHRFLPGMVRRGRGGILNIGSGAGLVAMPGAAVYGATKHFVDGFTEALQAELAGTGVVVTQVCPGPVATEFDDGDAAARIPAMPARLVRISAEQCAREALHGFERGRALVLPGARYRLLMRLLAPLPRPLHRLVARHMVHRLAAIA